MYQVIEMYGDYEPWWFLEDWEKDIVLVRVLMTIMKPSNITNANGYF